METKKCGSCGKVQDISNYHQDRSNKDKLQTDCKKCRQRCNTHARHKKFGLQVGDYDRWREGQNFCCAICGMHEEDNYQTGESLPRALAVDHCHINDEIRGLLCWRCNLGLGYFRDTPDALRAAANYLERFYGRQDA